MIKGIILTIWGITFALSVVIPITIIYLVYMFITQPELIHKWISIVISG